MGLLYVYAVWGVVMLDPHRWLATFGPDALHRTATFAFAGLIVVIALHIPTLTTGGTTEKLYLPFLAYALVTAVGIPLALNPTIAQETTQNIQLYYLLAVATLMFVRTARDALPIILLFILQYAWWAFHAPLKNAIRWHPLYANPDGFGSLMVLGVGFCMLIAYASRSKWLQRLGFLLAGYSLLGVVASNARGAVLAAAALLCFIWFRSPKKTQMILFGVAAAVVVVLTTDHAFWTEMQSTFTQGAREGTGRDRWVLWSTALDVFAQRPLLGVGAGNFGPYAAGYFGYGDVEGYVNPGTLYDRNLHSVYFQILSEFGTIGSLLFVWLLVDFWKRNRRLRDADRIAAWTASGGGAFDLRYLSFALEAGMLGFLMTGFFYAQLYAHWVYTLLTVNALLYRLTQPGAEPARKAGTRHRSRQPAERHRQVRGSRVRV